MDAQNAAESDQTRPAASSHQRRGSVVDKKSKSPTIAKASSPTSEAKSKGAAPVADDASSATARPDETPDDRDSDAETIVLPGKDGHSPSKARKVRQEDKSESDGDAAKRSGAAKDDTEKSNAASTTGAKPTEGARRKRLSVSAGSSADKDRRARTKDGASSGLSSAPTSPPNKDQKQDPPKRRRRSDAAVSSPSDSEQSQHKASKSTLRDKLKSGDRLLSQKRKAPKVESDDEGDFRKARRQRTTSAGIDGGRLPKESSTKSASHAKHDTRNRSPSPPLRQHRRSTSTQLPSQFSNGLSVKKRRLPPPLQSTEYQSDDSSTGGSPRPRSSKLRSLTNAAATDSNISPAKIGPHKKHLDAHGQTLLARACARGEYDGAKQRLGERPEDLNVADYAGNTPLQIAAINGCEDIVKLLVEAGCNLDCVNYNKDTPLLDAVDNGHLGVVKLLLEAGVNPRKANVNGEEPIDRVSDETENADEIRAALTDARKKAGERRRTSEDRHSHTDHNDARDDSPRHSPAATSAAGRRGGTVRSTKTRNDLLYMPLDDKTLRQAAGRGDEETVARILQVKEGYDDPESMVAAARGGHDLVIQLLLGLGGASADPAPAASLPAEFATPILAAIGQENIKVVELLLEQQGFDPTRRFKGETYYEIARRRQGTNWKEEEHLLRNSYDEYKRSHKDTLKTKSPSTRRDRERLREERAAAKRDDTKDDPRQTRRAPSSPSREGGELKKRTSNSSKLDSPREKRRNSTTTRGGDDEGQKRGPGRPKKEPSNNSDRESSPALSHKAHKVKRAESDAAGMSSDGEASKPRRKLISKGELRGERDKQKRVPSHKPPSSPREGRTGDEAPEKANLTEKYHDRAKALKRDESRDRPTGDGPTKRHRTSVTPDRPGDTDKDSSEVPVKRRRLESDAADTRQKRVSSEDARQRKSSSSRDGSAKPKDDSGKKDAESKSSGHGEKSILVKSEDVDVPMPDLELAKDGKSEAAGKPSQGDGEQSKSELAEEEARKEEQRKLAEAEAQKKRKEEEAAKKKREDEEAVTAAAAAVEAKKREEQEERERLEAAEAARKAEEERRRVEEEERKKKEKEEEERKQREEEERLRQEQLQREAAEEARRHREEEERKERERRERAHREEMERKRAAREAEQRRIREEQERARLEKLPPVLRWLDMHPGPKAAAVTDKFKHMLGVRYDTIRPEATGTVEGREQWVLNTHVALLLGEKDLDLSRCKSIYSFQLKTQSMSGVGKLISFKTDTAWERAPVSRLAKTTIWRTEWPRYTLLSEKLWDLGRQLPGYFGESDPASLDFQTKQQLKVAAWEKFVALDMFFVKVRLSICLCDVGTSIRVTDHLRSYPTSSIRCPTFLT